MRSLSTRLTVWYALASAATALALFVFGRVLLEKSYIAGIDQLNSAEFEEVRPRLLSPEAQDSPEAAADAVRRHAEIDAALYFFQIGRSDGRVFFASTNMAGRRLPTEVHGKSRITIEDSKLGSLRVSEFTAGVYVVYIASSLKGWNSLDARLLQLGLSILVIVFLASLAVGYGLSRLALRPIAGIRQAASRIGANNLAERIQEPATGDEIAELVRLLNRMFDRLEAAFLQARRFTADASHELKTPLSLIRLNAEALLGNEKLDPSEIRRLVEAQIEDIDRLNRMINDLLVLAKADAGALFLKTEETRIPAFIDDFAQDAEALCEERNVRFRLKNTSNETLRFDPVWIRHCLFNLLSNALKFTPPGGSVSLESEDDGKVWIIRLTDDGPGVDPAMLDRIFDRFYRVGGESSKEEGSGLGLALCRSIAGQHLGTVTARNRSDRSGLMVELRFPLPAAEYG